VQTKVRFCPLDDARELMGVIREALTGREAAQT